MKYNKKLFSIKLYHSVPLIFFVVTYIHYFYPGDEFFMWGLSSIAGTWIYILLAKITHANFFKDYLHISIALIALTGSLTLFPFAKTLQKRKISNNFFYFSYLIFFVLILIKLLPSFTSMRLIESKNGSILAYIFCSLNCSLYVTLVFAFIYDIRKSLKGKNLSIKTNGK